MEGNLVKENMGSKMLHFFHVNGLLYFRASSSASIAYAFACLTRCGAPMLPLPSPLRSKAIMVLLDQLVIGSC